MSEVAQPISQMIDRLPQTLDQLSAALRRQLSEGLIRLDDAP
ncbi:hypothetical protein [Streptomyces kanamyceticus]